MSFLIRVDGEEGSILGPSLHSSFDSGVVEVENKSVVHISGEYSRSSSGDSGTFISAVDLSLLRLVNKMDLCFPRQVGEGHIVEDDSIVVSRLELSKGVEVSNEQRLFEMGFGEASFSNP